MLDPIVSAGIKKYGVLKYLCMQLPYMVYSGVTAAIGVSIGIWAAYEERKKFPGAPFTSKYLVLRPNDPRKKYFKIWGADEVQD